MDTTVESSPKGKFVVALGLVSAVALSLVWAAVLAVGFPGQSFASTYIAVAALPVFGAVGALVMARRERRPFIWAWIAWYTNGVVLAVVVDFILEGQFSR